MDRRHRAGRDDEAEEAERAVGGSKEEPLADPAAHAAVGHVALELGGEPVAVRERRLERGPDQLARVGRALRPFDLPSHRRDERSHEGRVEHELVGLERRQSVVIVQVTHGRSVSLPRGPVHGSQ